MTKRFAIRSWFMNVVKGLLFDLFNIIAHPGNRFFDPLFKGDLILPTQFCSGGGAV
jgi:hypothetical protein